MFSSTMNSAVASSNSGALFSVESSALVERRDHDRHVDRVRQAAGVHRRDRHLWLVLVSIVQPSASVMSWPVAESIVEVHVAVIVQLGQAIAGPRVVRRPGSPTARTGSRVLVHRRSSAVSDRTPGPMFNGPSSSLVTVMVTIDGVRCTRRAIAVAVTITVTSPQAGVRRRIISKSRSVTQLASEPHQYRLSLVERGRVRSVKAVRRSPSGHRRRCPLPSPWHCRPDADVVHHLPSSAGSSHHHVRRRWRTPASNRCIQIPQKHRRVPPPEAPLVRVARHRTIHRPSPCRCRDRIHATVTSWKTAGTLTGAK